MKSRFNIPNLRIYRKIHQNILIECAFFKNKELYITIYYQKIIKILKFKKKIIFSIL